MLGTVSFPFLAIVATIVCCFIPHLAPYTTSIIYIYNLTFWRWFPFLLVLQSYIYLNFSILLAEFLTRFYLFAHSADIIVKELRPGIYSSLTKKELRTETNVHKVFQSLKYLAHRINWTFGRFLIPAHLVILICLVMYSNCTVVFYTSPSLLVMIMRKTSVGSYSLIICLYILVFGQIADKFSKRFLKLIKQWENQSKLLYYKKAFKAIPPLYLKIGDFAYMTKFTSMRILINAFKYTGMLLIQVMRSRRLS